MAKHGKHGLARRKEAEDNLAGMAEVKHAYLKGASITPPRAINVPVSAAGKMANALGKFASASLKDSVAARNARMQLDGQTMFMQGATLDRVQLNGGNPAAADGWRVMQATTIASAMTVTALERIKQTGGSQTADEFRQAYLNQMEAQLEGKDEQSKIQIRDHMTAQLPALVEAQTLAHMEYLEKKSFDALVISIDVTSQDPEGEDVTINFANVDDPNSAAAFLNADRQKAAVTKGVELAFTNNNPIAYAILKKAGIINKLTAKQQVAIENARNRFDLRMRGENNEERAMESQAIKDAMTHDDLSAKDAMQLQHESNAKWRIRDTYNEMVALTARASEVKDTSMKTIHKSLQRAIAAGDWKTAGRITAEYALFVESHGHKDALGPLILFGANKGTRAKGDMQVTDATAKNPGFGVVGIRNNSIEERHRVGVDYWMVLYKGNQSGYDLPWDAGDLEATAIAYNAGPDQAKTWFYNNKDYDVLHQTENVRDYVKKIFKRAGQHEAPTGADRYNLAVEMLAEAEGTALAENIRIYNIGMGQVYEDLASGKIDRDEFEIRAKSVRIEANLAQDQHTVATEAKKRDSILKAIKINKTKEEADLATLIWEDAMTQILGNMLAVVERDDATPEERKAAWDRYYTDGEAAAIEAGVHDLTSVQSLLVKRVQETISASLKKQRDRQESLANIKAAIINHTMDGLTKDEAEEAAAWVTRQAFKKVDDMFNSMHDFDNVDPGAKEAAQLYELASAWLNVQKVPQKITDAMSSAIMRGLVDKEGGFSEAALSALMQYKAILDQDQHGNIAADFFTDEARVVADMVLQQAGPLGVIPEAMQIVGNKLQTVTVPEATAWARSEEMNEEVDAIIRDMVNTDDIGFWQALVSPEADQTDSGAFLPMELESLRSEHNQELVREAFRNELVRLKIAHPRNPTAWMLNTARKNVELRTANIGGSTVFMAIDIKKAIFGTKIAQFDKDGIENQVIKEYLQSPDMLQAHPGIARYTGVETLQEGTQKFVTAISAGYLVWNAGMSRRDQLQAIANGIRPIEAFTSLNGKRLYIKVMNPDGNWGDPIWLDLKAAGAWHMSREAPFRSARDRREAEIGAFADQP